MSGQGVPPWQSAYHARVDPHRGASMLTSVILGAQDGIVAVLGVLLGVAAASRSARLVIAAGFATAFADAISMAAVAYTTAVAQGDVYRSERAREYRHIKALPALERQEVRELYARKGFAGDLLDRIVATITADPDVWVAVMMAEEHGLGPVERSRTLRSALVVGLATLLGAALPVVPFTVMGLQAATWSATLVAASALFAVGVYKARTTQGSVVRAGLEMASIGLASALASWAIGSCFGGAGY
ncbi:MAG: VIT1/CCC1 transporter family protein [Polyangiaceae bacterium]